MKTKYYEEFKKFLHLRRVVTEISKIFFSSLSTISFKKKMSFERVFLKHDKYDNLLCHQCQ